VRVMHAGVPYDRRASPGDSLSIQVFDAAPKVGGITGSIEILRAGTEGAFLHVSDMFEVTNASSPPMTQAGKRTFEVYLPADARIDSILAAGPEKVATMLSASPVPREPGHYLLNFPLRPGTTKFAFNYNLPYRGRAVFQTRLAYPLGQLAVMLSPSMRFSSPSSAFVLLATGNSDYQVHATNQLKAGQGPLFVISGVGAFPSLGGQAKSQALSQPWFSAEPTEAIVRPASPASRTSAGPLLRPTPSYTRPSSPSSVLIVLSAVLFAASGLWIWRVRRTLPTGGYGTAFGSSQRRPITTVSSPPLREKCTNR